MADCHTQQYASRIKQRKRKTRWHVHLPPIIHPILYHTARTDVQQSSQSNRTEKMMTASCYPSIHGKHKDEKWKIYLPPILRRTCSRK